MEGPRRTAPELMRRYFLGELSEDEGALVEEAYLADELAFAQAVAIEEELIEAYAEGRLSEREREAFRVHLLRSPHQRLSAQLVADLLRSGARKKPVPALSRRAWLALAAAVFTAAVAGTLAWRGPRPSTPLPSPPDRAVTPASAGASASPASEAAQPLHPAAAALEAPSLRLSPGRARGSGETAELVVPRGAERVRLELELTGVERGSFDPVLRSAEGAQLWSGALLALSGAARHPRTSLLVPAEVLAPGDYVLVLERRAPGSEARDAAEYFFRILDTK